VDVASTALVVVDVQNGFVTEFSRPIVPTVADLVERWQAAGGAVVFTRYLNYEGSPFERIIRWYALRDSPETDLVPELLPYVGDERAVVFDKRIYSLFTPEGAEFVRAAGWTDLVFCGIATESCVLKSAVDAFELGYTPWILQDASASHAGPAAHAAGLLVAGRFIGPDQIIPTQKILDLLPAAASPAS
jgi:nicotinamidase-related amidase